MRRQILIGISGGIDSAAATLLLREAGYDVVALWIDMLGCAAQRKRVIELCDELQVPLLIESVGAKFQRKVVAHTLAEHQAGRTPSPCAVCNVEVKFATLLAVADREGISSIATGHYVQIVERSGAHYVARGVDSVKDQSYYLYALGEETLRRVVTPLGGMKKSDVRQFLASRGFEQLATGGESQGLCFVERGYGEFLRANISLTSGSVIDGSGVIVGAHDGYQLYTIGQKRGFESSTQGEIRRIDPQGNIIEIGEPLFSSVFECHAAQFRPLTGGEPLRVAVRGLGRNPQGEARVEQRGDRLLITLLADPAWAVSAGQPVVIYCGDVVVGGGVCAELH